MTRISSQSRPKVRRRPQHQGKLTERRNLHLLRIIRMRIHVTRHIRRITKLRVHRLHSRIHRRHMTNSIRKRTRRSINQTLMRLTQRPTLHSIRLRRHVTQRRHRTIRLTSIPHTSSRPPQIQITPSFISSPPSLIINTAINTTPYTPLNTMSQPRFTVTINPLIPSHSPILTRMNSINLTTRRPRRLISSQTRVRLLHHRRQGAHKRIRTRLITRRQRHPNTNTIKLTHTLNRSTTSRIIVNLRQSTLHLPISRQSRHKATPQNSRRHSASNSRQRNRRLTRHRPTRNSMTSINIQRTRRLSRRTHGPMTSHRRPHSHVTQPQPQQMPPRRSRRRRTLRHHLMSLQKITHRNIRLTNHIRLHRHQHQRQTLKLKRTKQRRRTPTTPNFLTPRLTISMITSTPRTRPQQSR